MRRCSPLWVLIVTSPLAGCGKPADGGNTAGADTADSLWLRGIQSYKQKKFDEAIQDFDAALKLDAKYAPALRDRGVCYSVKKDYTKALADLNEYVKLRPEDPEGYDFRAVAHDGNGDKKASSADLATARRLRSKNK